MARLVLVSLDMSKPTLTPAQKRTLAIISAAGPEGVLEQASWPSAASLVRKGIVRREIVHRKMPATKFYPDGSRFDTHTCRGRLRFLTIVRWTVVA